MTDNDRSCGCHTIYLLKRGSCIKSEQLDVARMTPGAIISYDNGDDLTPMIWHTCGSPSIVPRKKLLVGTDAGVICETNA